MAADGPVRARLARDVSSYLHIPLVLGIVFTAVTPGGRRRGLTTRYRTGDVWPAGDGGMALVMSFA